MIEKIIPTAIAMAISDSVTVSMGLDTRGALRQIFLVRAEERSTSLEVKSMKPGRMMKSLKQNKAIYETVLTNDLCVPYLETWKRGVISNNSIYPFETVRR